MTGFPSPCNDFSTFDVAMWLMLFAALTVIASLPIFAACVAIVRRCNARSDDGV